MTSKKCLQIRGRPTGFSCRIRPWQLPAFWSDMCFWFGKGRSLWKTERLSTSNMSWWLTTYFKWWQTWYLVYTWVWTFTVNVRRVIAWIRFPGGIQFVREAAIRFQMSEHQFQQRRDRNDWSHECLFVFPAQNFGFVRHSNMTSQAYQITVSPQT